MSAQLVLQQGLSQTSGRMQCDASLSHRSLRGATHSRLSTYTPSCLLRSSPAHHTGRHAAARRSSSYTRGNGRRTQEICSSALEVGTASVDALPPKKKLCCFVSGGGSNMRKIQEAIEDGRINGEITVRHVFKKPNKFAGSVGHGRRRLDGRSR
eukprot:7806197-Pyramimonas_sp.AAC.1